MSECHICPDCLAEIERLRDERDEAKGTVFARNREIHALINRAEQAEARLARVVRKAGQCGLTISHGWGCPALAEDIAAQPEEKK